MPAAPATETAFDARLAVSGTRTLPLAQILDLLPLSHAPGTVEGYRRRMLAGDRFPPVSVVRLAGRWLLADGHKRLTAFSSLATDETIVVVEVWSTQRWLGDQLDQARANLRKNRAILAATVRDPAQARLLARATWGHWRRVAASLWHLAIASRPGTGAGAKSTPPR